MADDLPSNTGLSYREYGVMMDRRDQGLGFRLVETSRILRQALDIAFLLGDKARVHHRQVTHSPWSGPVVDNSEGGA